MFNSGQANRDWKAVVSAVWNFWTSKTGAFILAVSGIAVGYYIFYISRPILKYETEKVTFISSQNDNAYSVKVKGREYQDLYLTRIYLNNKGAMALSGSDVSKIGHDPIRIVIPKDAKMVHYTLDNTATTNAITARLEEIDGNLVIKFDYLNPDYQIAASILHENPDAEFEVTGSALNVNEITRDSGDCGVWGFCILSFCCFIFTTTGRRKKLESKFNFKFNFVIQGCDCLRKINGLPLCLRQNHKGVVNVRSPAVS